MWWMILFGLAAGGALGYGWSRLVRCQGGECAVGNRWQLAVVFGAALGLYVAVQWHTANQAMCAVHGPAEAPSEAVTESGNRRQHRYGGKFMAELISTEADFETKVLQADKPVLVDFYADWCGPCKFLAPVVEEVATEMAGKADVYKVDVDKLQGLAAKYGIQSIPTVIVFSGGEAANAFVGVRGKEEYLAAINQAAGG